MNIPDTLMMREALDLVARMGLQVQFHTGSLPKGIASVVGDVGFHPPVFHLESRLEGWHLLHEIGHWIVAEEADRSKVDFGLRDMSPAEQDDYEYRACLLTLGLLQALNAPISLVMELGDELGVLDCIPESERGPLLQAAEASARKFLETLP